MRAPRIRLNCLLLVCALCVGLLPLGPAGTAAESFNGGQLKKMVRLLQSLRTKVADRLNAMSTRGSTLTQSVSDAQLVIKEESANTTLIAATYWADVVNMATNLKEVKTSAVKANLMKYDATRSYLANVTISRSISYSVGEATARASYAGVYLYHVNLRTGVRQDTYFDIIIRDASGAIKTSLEYFMDWEVAPIFLFLDLQAGETVTIRPIDTANLRTETEGTHVSLHFLSNFAQPPPAPTLSPPPPTTSPIWG